MPDASGCTTDSEVATAIAASTALPPRARVSKPASVASALALAIAAVFGGGVLPCAWTSKLDVAIATASAGRYHHAVRRCAVVRQAGLA